MEQWNSHCEPEKPMLLPQCLFTGVDSPSITAKVSLLGQYWRMNMLSDECCTCIGAYLHGHIAVARILKQKFNVCKAAQA